MALGLAVALIVVIAAVRARSAWRAAGVVDQAEVRSGRASRLVRHGRPTATTGVGAALDTRRAGVGIAAMVGCVVATAAAAAAIVFGASLAELVDEPETYGWPWDVAVITGAGYGDTAIDVVDERLAQPDVRDDILDHGFYSFDPAIVFGDRPAPVVFGWSGRTAGDLPVREGRAPDARRRGPHRRGHRRAARPRHRRLGRGRVHGVRRPRPRGRGRRRAPVARSVRRRPHRARHRRLHAGGRRAQRAQRARLHRHPAARRRRPGMPSSTGCGTTCRSWSAARRDPR